MAFQNLESWTHLKHRFCELVTIGNTIRKPSESSEDFKGQQEAGESCFMCEICLETLPSAILFNNKTNTCSRHSYCLKCIEEYIQAKTEEYNVSEIKCPGLGCNETFDPLFCRSFLSAEVFVKWCDVLCEATVSQYQKSYCPFRNCSALILNECGGTIGKTNCQNCKNHFCFECKTPWHVGFTCRQTQTSDVLLHQLMDLNGWKRCPKCNHGVELRSGCANVRCRCGTRFCYACGKMNCSCRGERIRRILLLVRLICCTLRLLILLYDLLYGETED